MYEPLYFSVTYGAGGSTQERTLDTVRQLIDQGNNVTPHMSCIGATQSLITDLLDQYTQQGIKRLVCLRGDLPSGAAISGGDFQYASDLVRYIRETTGDYFHIEVAAYPESHPEAANIQDDLLHYKAKCDAGANGAITQYFYDANAYEQLLNDCARLHIDTPITPGIMPITNYTQLKRFSDMCGAQIPRWIQRRLEAFGDDTASFTHLALM